MGKIPPLHARTASPSPSPRSVFFLLQPFQQSSLFSITDIGTGNGECTWPTTSFCNLPVSKFEFVGQTSQLRLNFNLRSFHITFFEKRKTEQHHLMTLVSRLIILLVLLVPDVALALGIPQMKQPTFNIDKSSAYEPYRGSHSPLKPSVKYL